MYLPSTFVTWLFKCKTTYLLSIFNNVCWHQGLSHTFPPRQVGLACSCNLQWYTPCINHDGLYEPACSLILQGGTENMCHFSASRLSSWELSPPAREGVAGEERVKRRALERQAKCNCCHYSRRAEVQVAVTALGKN